MSLRLHAPTIGGLSACSGHDGIHPTPGGPAELDDRVVGPDPAHAQFAERSREVRLTGDLHRPGFRDSEDLGQLRQRNDLWRRNHVRTLRTYTLDNLYAVQVNGR